MSVLLVTVTLYMSDHIDEMGEYYFRGTIYAIGIKHIICIPGKRFPNIKSQQHDFYNTRKRRFTF